MARKHHYQSKSKEQPEMDVTTFLNLMVVLIPFLLISAVFTRITIMELDIPSGSGNVNDKPTITIEVILRESGLEIGNGSGVIANLPKINGQYDLKKLSEYLLKIKQNYPDKTDATILVELDIQYDYMVQVMDSVRSTKTILEGAEEAETIVLFPDMSLGEAS